MNSFRETQGSCYIADMGHPQIVCPEIIIVCCDLLAFDVDLTS